jgi:hypothetical protein
MERLSTEKRSSHTYKLLSGSSLKLPTTSRSESLVLSQDEAASGHLSYSERQSLWGLRTEAGMFLVRYARWLGVRWGVGHWPDYSHGRFLVDRYPDLAHEISHWIFASPYRRQAKHFGLGAPGDFEAELVTDELAEAEESISSLLGISMVYTLGCEASARHLYQDHNWVQYQTLSRSIYPILRSRGFITYDRLPVQGECMIPVATFRHVNRRSHIQAAAELLRKHSAIFG